MTHSCPTRRSSDLKPQPGLRLAEGVPVGLLLAICLGLMIFAGPTMRYMERTGRSLDDRQGYIQSLLAPPRAEQTAGEPGGAGPLIRCWPSAPSPGGCSSNIHLSPAPLPSAGASAR